MFFGKLTAGLASEMIDVNYDPDKFDSERKALLNGTKGHYIHEFTKKIPGLGEAMGNIEQTAQVKAPLFLLKTLNAKTQKEAKISDYVYIQNSDIKKLICTDTIKLPKEKQIDKIEVVSISDMLADIIHANNVGESVTAVVRKYRDLDYTDK